MWCFLQIAEDLSIIRNNVVFIYVMMNFLWCVIALQLQAMEDTLKSFYIVEKYEPLSLAFLAVFALVLLLQFLSMLVHRWGTFLHLMASTRIDWCHKSHSEEEFARYVVNQTKLLQNLEPLPDYNDDDGDEGGGGGGGDDAGFNSSEEEDEDGMSLSDFDPSLRGDHLRNNDNHNHNLATNGAGSSPRREQEEGGGIYETLGRRHHHHHAQLRYPAAFQTDLHRTRSTNGQFPLLKTMFERKLTDLQQRYHHQQRGTLRGRGQGGGGRGGGAAASWLGGGTQRRLWGGGGGDRNGEMRQRFFNHHFQLPQPHHRGDRLFRGDAGHVV